MRGVGVAQSGFHQGKKLQGAHRWRLKEVDSVALQQKCLCGGLGGGGVSCNVHGVIVVHSIYQVVLHAGT
mgnify:CR=1